MKILESVTSVMLNLVKERPQSTTESRRSSPFMNSNLFASGREL